MRSNPHWLPVFETTGREICSPDLERFNAGKPTKDQHQKNNDQQHTLSFVCCPDDSCRQCLAKHCSCRSLSNDPLIRPVLLMLRSALQTKGIVERSFDNPNNCSLDADKFKRGVRNSAPNRSNQSAPRQSNFVTESGATISRHTSVQATVDDESRDEAIVR